MIKKYYLTLDDEFIKYCQLNNIVDIEKMAAETFKRGFTELKYGDTIPNTIIKKGPIKMDKKDNKEIVTKKTDIYGE